MILSSFLGIFFINNIIATELQKIIRNFAVEKIKKDLERKIKKDLEGKIKKERLRRKD
mgnify:FL=1